MPRFSRHSTFPSRRPTFLCPCVDRVVTSSLHRFPSPQHVAFAYGLLPGPPQGMYSPHQHHSFVSYTDRGHADTFGAQHTNKPAPLVSLLETYLTSSLLSSTFLFFGCCYSYHCLQSCNTFDYYPPFLSLPIVLVLICFNSVTLCLSPNLYNCMMQMVFRPIGLASLLLLSCQCGVYSNNDNSTVDGGNWERTIIGSTSFGKGGHAMRTGYCNTTRKTNWLVMTVFKKMRG